MNLTFFNLIVVALVTANSSTDNNPVYKELVEKGITMSNGTSAKLPPPILGDGLTAAAQRTAIGKADARNSVADLVRKSYYAPVTVKVRTAKRSRDEGPAIRNVDLWFVAHGDWKILTSKDFLESVTKAKEEGQSRVVAKSGILTDKEMAARKLTAKIKEGYEERFVYTIFSLLERVEISTTRLAVLTRGKDSVLAAAKIDRRFDKDPDYPNQWRPLLRDEQAAIKLGPAHPFDHLGVYAKITRLLEPADAIFIELHLVYEEPYGWFDGANLVSQKAPLMVQEKVRTFRRKLASAGEKKEEKGKP